MTGLGRGPAIGADRATVHALPRGRMVLNRNRALLTIARGRRVAHIGCTDAPFMDQMVANGTLFHAQLASAASTVVGVDIDAAGIAELRRLVPGQYLVGDIADEAVADQLAAAAPEVIIAADVIEHVPDPLAFLRALAGVAERVAPCAIVVTTPNGLALRPAMQTPFGFEVMHPDHLALFTPTIIATLCDRAGLDLRGLRYYNQRHTRAVATTTAAYAATQLSDGVVRLATTMVSPAWADGMLVLAGPRA